MSRANHRTRSRATAASIIVLLLGAGVSHAGSIPDGALVNGSGLPAIFLDDVTLLFRFPQWAVGRPSQAFAVGLSGNSDRNSRGLGAVWSRESCAFFLLSQPAAPIGPTHLQGQAFQGGCAFGAGPVKLGAGGRWGYQEDDHTIEVLPEEPRQTYALSQERIHSRAREGSFGVEIGREDHSLSVVADFRDGRTETTDETITQSPGISEVEWHNLTERWKGTPLLTVRYRWLSHEGSGLIFTGEWSEEEVEYHVDVEDQGLQSSTNRRRLAKRWSVGAARLLDVQRTGILTLYAYFQREERPTSFDIYSSYFSERKLKQGRTTVGLSFRRDIRRGAELLMGIRGHYVESHSVTDRYDSETLETSDRSVQVDTDLVDRFSWGIALRRGRFRLVSSMDSRLNLNNLFLNLDTGVFF